MKKQINHSEIANELKVQVSNMESKMDSLSAKIVKLYENNLPRTTELDEYHSIQKQLGMLKSQLSFHTIMCQDKKYASRHLHSDIQAFEIIEEKSATSLIVRRMVATMKKDAQDALRESFSPGGFCGHYENSLQEWTCTPDASAPMITIRRHRDGRWYDCGGMLFTIEPEPRNFYDYNF